MRRAKFKLFHLLILILGVSLALVGLREATDFWLGVAVAGTFLWVGFALGRAFSPRKSGVIFWRGMAAGGLTYLLLSCGPWGPTRIEPWLPTTRLLTSLLPNRHRQPKYRIYWHDLRGNTICSTDIYGDKISKPIESQPVVRSLTVAESGSALGNAEPGEVIVSQVDTGQFRLIGHLEVGFCIAIVAGWLIELFATQLSERDATKRLAPRRAPSFANDHAGM